MKILKFEKDKNAKVRLQDINLPHTNIGFNFISVLTGRQTITCISTYIIYTLFTRPRCVVPIMINTNSSW